MNEIELIAKIVTWPTAVALIVYFTRPLWTAFADKIKGSTSGSDGRLAELEAFRVKAETNHFHDLDTVMLKVDDLRRDFDNFRVSSEGRFTRLEAKVTNGFAEPSPKR